MANALPNTTATVETAEPADNRTYINLVIAFMVGIVFLMGLFVAMLLILAQAG